MDREPNLLSGTEQFQMAEPSTAKQRQEVAEIMALLAEVITFTRGIMSFSPFCRK